MESDLFNSDFAALLLHTQGAHLCAVLVSAIAA